MISARLRKIMLFIDYKSGLPIYEQVYNGILRLADIGALKPGDQLPSVRAVASEAGLNPNTVQSRRRAALENLGKAVEEAVRAGVPADEILAAVRESVEKGSLGEERGAL